MIFNITTRPWSFKRILGHQYLVRIITGKVQTNLVLSSVNSIESGHRSSYDPLPTGQNAFGRDFCIQYRPFWVEAVEKFPDRTKESPEPSQKVFGAT